MDIGIHKVTSIETSFARVMGGSDDCPHTFAVRIITVTDDTGHKHEIKLFGSKLADLEVK